MYSIDINFLNDREERPVVATGAPIVRQQPTSDRTPIVIGAGVLVAALAGVGGFLGLLKYQESNLQKRQAELDSQLTELQAKLAEVDRIKAETAAARDESRALASVFTKIRPWSAIVKDIQNRIPTRAQLTQVSQTEGEAVPVEDGGEPVVPEAGGISINGTACSFDDVNDFVLTLKNSPFLEGETVALTTSNLGSEVLGRCPGEAQRDEPTQLVNYTIAGNIKSVSTEQFDRLLAELENQQASVGLSSRLKALLETGVLE
ncbi:pilus assembly protein PilN [Leptolyngbyaceae cyanobacterium CCMR0082]|uniref:Pilus assembly protein PilN n=2 Tax=Adonisia turfae TaxID=2950184 RepID=A0A6M0S950_9CYAN|nr:PilN domain-containing protein [Adonisia turfae]MDV3347439.1 PilN domain-containing protein [Leptothoe sp. LEGE 181152]NEZ56576.1 pilus assembly protein PilN [Adonisia turfae CCMR0081]NEZ64521.1 pilus assembly protein PilN [Adonisia turfae CCMR0082]